MGRPPKFVESELFDAVAAVVADEGPRAITTRRIARAVGAPTGSLYHRFRTRDLLVAHAWLDAVRAFQAGFLTALDHDDVDLAATAAARHTPRWAATHPTSAALLLRHHRAELLARWPDELTAQLESLNTPIDRALREHARRRFGRTQRPQLIITRFALIHLPEAAVRSTTDPAALVGAVGAAALAALRAA